MKRSRNNLKLVAAISLCIFSLAVLFTGTVSWFMAYRDQQIASTDFSVVDVSGNFNRLYIHELDTAQSTTTTYKFNKDATCTFVMNWATKTASPTEGSEPVDFGEYSLSSRRHAVLFIYEFLTEIAASSENPVVITADTDETFVADGETEVVNGNTQTKIKLKATKNPLSSIVKFRSFAYDHNGVSTYNSTTLTYDYAVSSLTHANGGQSFVTMTTSGNEIVYSSFVEDGIIDFYRSTTGNIKYVAVVMDYYEDALSFIYNYYLGTSALDNDTITFKCDWTTYIV